MKGKYQVMSRGRKRRRGYLFFVRQPLVNQKERRRKKTRLLAGFRVKAGCFRFGGDFCWLNMQELFHGTARVTLRHRKIVNMITQVVSTQQNL